MNERIPCKGGCHCGAVTFRLQLPRQLQVLRCNCSICAMTAYLHLTVSHADFELLSGEGVLQEYRFSTGQARHLFCRHCGIKSFYQPRSHPQAWSVNLRCVALPEGLEIRMVEFDGQDWERHVENIVEAVN